MTNAIASRFGGNHFDEQVEACTVTTFKDIIRVAAPSGLAVVLYHKSDGSFSVELTSTYSTSSAHTGVLKVTAQKVQVADLSFALERCYREVAQWEWAGEDRAREEQADA